MGEFAYDYVGIEAELGMKDADYREGAAGGGREPMHYPRPEVVQQVGTSSEAPSFEKTS